MQMELNIQIKEIKTEFEEIKKVLNERSTRIWCASKARSYNRKHGRGGITVVSKATQVSRSRIYRGIRDIEEEIGKSNKRREEKRREEKRREEKRREEGGGRKKNY